MNQRGISFFFRSLQSQLRVLVSQDLLSINSEDLQQLWETLLDSSATVILLVEDLHCNRITITGLTVESLGRLSALKRDISVITDYIPNTFISIKRIQIKKLMHIVHRQL